MYAIQPTFPPQQTLKYVSFSTLFIPALCRLFFSTVLFFHPTSMSLVSEQSWAGRLASFPLTLNLFQSKALSDLMKLKIQFFPPSLINKTKTMLERG